MEYKSYALSLVLALTANDYNMHCHTNACLKSSSGFPTFLDGILAELAYENVVLLVAVVGARRGASQLLLLVDLVAAGRADQLRCTNFVNGQGGDLGGCSGPRELVGFEDVRCRLAPSRIIGGALIRYRF